jgi:transcriptional regulator with XRE-family HTH domain
MGATHHHDHHDVAERGRARRRALGLSVAAVARRMGVRRSRVHNLECYGAGSLVVVARWAVALCMDPGELAFGRPPAALRRAS